MKRLNIVVVLALGISTLGGCSLFKTHAVDNGAGDRTGGSDANGATTQGIEAGSDFTGIETQGPGGSRSRYQGEKPWNDPQSPLYNTVIYFEFDSSTVRPAYESLIATHAEYLAAHPDLGVTMEGHADERGTREYNIALGEQRAITVARMMKLQGVEDVQIKVISYGEEKQVAFEHNESAWRQNRRVQIKYPK